MTSMVISTYS
nr:TPA_asm: m26.6 sORF 1 [Murid betaherpesvirus 1]DBA07753.1 TPA_asm: m26.6 sORF 1 [Murid betaherpesvirus 1]